MPTFLSLTSRALTWTALALALLPPPALAQGELTPEQQQALAAQQVRQQATQRILAAGSVPLEGAVDPAEYVVGPGDVFSISVGGALATQTAAAVSADGALIVPEIGSFEVAGLTLAEARARVAAGLRRIYRNVETEVALAQPRQFYVHVSGAVEAPGRRVAIPVARVEDALAEAMGGESPVQAFRRRRAENPRASLPALRNVEVRRRGTAPFSVDLLRYYTTGDLSENPYLRDGDALYVPTFNVEGGALTVGLPRRPDEVVDYRPGDRLTDVLLVVGGRGVAERGRARIIRTGPDGALVASEYALGAIAEGAAADPPLQPLDRIQVLADVGRGLAIAAGEVAHPGAYPIAVGETTLRDLVEAVGGITSEGLLRAAYLERRGAAWEAEGLPSLEAVDPEERVALLEQTTFENARLSDLPFGSRQYMVRELLQFQRVSLDLGDDPATIPPIPLRDGDRFVVPRDPGAVRVIGQVRNPGLIPLEPGADAAYYIERAGGLGPAATGVYVREAGTGYLRPPGGAPIRSGDFVFVDREVIADTEALQALALQEQQFLLQEEREARSARFELIRTGLALVGTVATVVTTYLLITDSGN